MTCSKAEIRAVALMSSQRTVKTQTMDALLLINYSRVYKLVKLTQPSCKIQHTH